MYNGQALGMTQQCEPNYETRAASLKKEIDVFTQTKNALMSFIEHLGIHSMSRNPSSIPEFIGQLEIDRKVKIKEFNEITEMMEKEK